MHLCNGKVLYIICIVLASTSCVSTSKSVYFNAQQKAVIADNLVIPEAIIQQNDLLSISVSSLNPGASSVFNSVNYDASRGTIGAEGSNSVSIAGYLVDKNGNIQFPVLGTLKAEGLTNAELRTLITQRLTTDKLLLDPVITIRQLNFKVTILGEVSHPMVINVPTEKITLFEALGLAGDITIYGKKDNVMVIRQSKGQRTIERLNLNSSEIFSSPYYYLMSSDVVYVEPTKAKVASSSRSYQLLPVIFGGLSFAVIVLDRLIR